MTTDGVKEEVVGRRSRLVSALALTVFAMAALAILLNRDTGVATPVFMEARDNLDGETSQGAVCSQHPDQ